MKRQILFRKIHLWGSVIIAVPLIIMIATGILLMLKKEVSWIQPSTQKGQIKSEVPTVSLQEMFAQVKKVPEAKVHFWTDLDKVDFKTSKGIAKFISKNGWEIQIDTSNASVVQVAYRRSDIIEKIHDGSWFAEWAKLGLFLPASFILLILWGTGLYLFFLPRIIKRQKRKKKGL